MVRHASSVVVGDVLNELQSSEQTSTSSVGEHTSNELDHVVRVKHGSQSIVFEVSPSPHTTTAWLDDVIRALMWSASSSKNNCVAVDGEALLLGLQ